MATLTTTEHGEIHVHHRQVSVPVMPLPSAAARVPLEAIGRRQSNSLFPGWIWVGIYRFSSAATNLVIPRISCFEVFRTEIHQDQQIV